MKLLSLIVVLLLLAAVALVILKKRFLLSDGDGPWPFYAKRPLTQPEQILYHRLVKSLPEHIVLAQVQVSRVLGVKKGFKFNEWNNRINRLSYDFVVCAKDSTVLAAIELDDKSHEACIACRDGQEEGEGHVFGGRSTNTLARKGVARPSRNSSSVRRAAI